MIIKKPYAFIIKNFKIIHTILFLMLCYIAFKFLKIFAFFNDYVKTNYYAYYENIGSHFVNIYMIIIIVLILFVFLMLFIIMKTKNKKRSYYLFSIGYYIIAIIYLIIMYSILNNLAIQGIDIREIRALRDISLIMFLPQIYFTIFAFLRATGFDIKSFDFKKDIEELKIDIQDNEAVEILVPNDSYKFARKIRRIFREFKYFIVEYKLFIIIIGSVVVLAISISLVINYQNNYKKYKENVNFSVGNIKYNVENSYLTKVDYAGNIIDETKAYVVIALSLENQGKNSERLETQNLRLFVDDKIILPIFTKGEKFIDLGQSYSNQYLEPDKEFHYILIFEIDGINEKSSYSFGIYNYGKIEESEKKVSIKPKYLDTVKFSDNYNIGDLIEFGESNLKKSSLKINKYEISDFFDETFDYCVADNCFKGIKRFVPNIMNATSKIILKLECDSTIDNELYLNKKIATGSDLISYFGSISYGSVGNIKKLNINVLQSQNIDGNLVFIEVPAKVKESDKIALNIVIRNVKYVIVLK